MKRKEDNRKLNKINWGSITVYLFVIAWHENFRVFGERRGQTFCKIENFAFSTLVKWYWEFCICTLELSVYIFVCMYVWMYVHIYMQWCVCMCACMFMYMYLWMHMHVCACRDLKLTSVSSWVNFHFSYWGKIFHWAQVCLSGLDFMYALGIWTPYS